MSYTTEMPGVSPETHKVFKMSFLRLRFQRENAESC
jgi:hypothetical protein